MHSQADCPTYGPVYLLINVELRKNMIIKYVVLVFSKWFIQNNALLTDKKLSEEKAKIVILCA